MLVKKNTTAKSDEITQPNKLNKLVKKPAKEENNALPATKSPTCSLGTVACSTPSLFSATKTEKNLKTVIVIKYDVGFNNELSIRGNFANLSWEKGSPLKNVSKDEWVWETSLPFSDGEFKVLINDQKFESGENHKVKSGTNNAYKPRF